MLVDLIPGQNRVVKEELGSRIASSGRPLSSSSMERGACGRQRWQMRGMGEVRDKDGTAHG